jgi:hypothetical protein
VGYDESCVDFSLDDDRLIPKEKGDGMDGWRERTEGMHLLFFFVFFLFFERGGEGRGGLEFALGYI